MKLSQADRILLELRSGEWVPTSALVQIAFQYNARIKDLRDRGHNIVNRRDVANPQITYFRLVREGELPLYHRKEGIG
jgi:hypothetical protein